jgi:cobalt-precorrin 5A hydrolase
MIVAGIGCRTGVAAGAVRQILRDAVRHLPEAAVGAELILAVPEFRRHEPGIAEAASALGLPVVWVGRAALRGEQGRCLTRSARAEIEVGLASVAEAAALSAAGPGARLVLPRIAGAGVTCALAERDPS